MKALEIRHFGQGANRGESDPPVVPYDFKWIVTGLNQVVNQDWATFLNDRIDGINPHADLEGIEQDGYQLIYTDKPSDYEKAYLNIRGAARELWFSL